MIDRSRRNLIKHSLAASGGLFIEIHGEALASGLTGTKVFGDQGAERPQLSEFRPTPFLEFKPSGEVIFYCPRVEMGQGIMTALTQIIADELNTEPSKFIVVQAPNNRAFGNSKLFGIQSTGGSTSVQDSFEVLRHSAARVRGLLIAAASKKLDLNAREISLKNFLLSTPKGEIAISDIVSEASQMSLPKTDPFPKEKRQFLGKSTPRVDSLTKVSGKATYGIDVMIPNMRIAIVLRSGIRGVKLKSFNVDILKDKQGYFGAYVISSGLALVFDKYWRARQYLETYRESIVINWEEHTPFQFTSPQVYAGFIASGDGSEVRSDGNVDEIFAKKPKIHEATYSVPFQPHMTMEPQNCTARVLKDSADVWAPIQFVTQAEDNVAEVTGLPKEKIRIHNTAVGGGFGRRLETDFVHEAVEIAKASGETIKVIWSREEDFSHDFYRPAALHKLKVAWNDEGKIEAWSHHTASQSILKQRLFCILKAAAPDWLPDSLRNLAGASGRFIIDKTGKDPTITEGASDWPYDCHHVNVTGYAVDGEISVGFWRSVGFSHNIFAREGMINEVCSLMGTDSLEWRRKNLSQNPELQRVLESVAKLCDWNNTEKKSGVGLGVATAHCYGSYIAMVVKVQVANGVLKVSDVYASLDCGFALNPRGVEDQLASAVIFALSAALYGKLTFELSKPIENNYDTHPILRHSESPRFHYEILPSEAPPEGVGEVGVVVLAPALSQAIFHATGVWKRDMPFCKEGNQI